MAFSLRFAAAKRDQHAERQRAAPRRRGINRLVDLRQLLAWRGNACMWLASGMPAGRAMRHGFWPDTGFRYMLKNGRKGSGI